MTEEGNPKENIVHAAAGLLAQGGREAVTTRAVAAAAGVQAPTIYRHFGDMRALLDAVAGYGFAAHLREKTKGEPSENPLEALREGWDLHVAFGLANPAFYALMYGDPRPDAEVSAAAEGYEALHALIRRVAQAGLLRLSVENAASMFHAAGCGVTLTLLSEKPERRDLTLSAQMREVTLKAITVPTARDRDATIGEHPKVTPQEKLISRAVALKALLSETEIGETKALSAAEKMLLTEWLDRLSRVAV